MCSQSNHTCDRIKIKPCPPNQKNWLLFAMLRGRVMAHTHVLRNNCVPCFFAISSFVFSFIGAFFLFLVASSSSLSLSLASPPLALSRFSYFLSFSLLSGLIIICGFACNISFQFFLSFRLQDFSFFFRFPLSLGVSDGTLVSDCILSSHWTS